MSRMVQIASGKRFGRLVVIGLAESKDARARFECKCDCGTLATVEGRGLRRGTTKSCGCLKNAERGTEDISGVVFVRLTARELIDKNKHGKFLWRCDCACGKEVIVSSNALKRGNTKSCGCWKNEATSKRFKTHGKRQTPEYNSWAAMKSRCLSESNQDYAEYGGRGITVCKRWLNSFENFLSDMGQRPFARATIERRDNSKGYGPTNCKWATQKEQCRNKRSNRIITVYGTSLTVAEWSDRSGVSQGRIYARLKLGWAPEKAIDNRLFHKSGSVRNRTR